MMEIATYNSGEIYRSKINRIFNASHPSIEVMLTYLVDIEERDIKHLNLMDEGIHLNKTYTNKWKRKIINIYSE